MARAGKRASRQLFFRFTCLRKALTNIVGMGVAASGYALGKAMTTVQNSFTSDDAVVADSMIFQMAFSTWRLGLQSLLCSISTWKPS